MFVSIYVCAQINARYMNGEMLAFLNFCNLSQIFSAAAKAIVWTVAIKNAVDVVNLHEAKTWPRANSIKLLPTFSHCSP